MKANQVQSVPEENTVPKKPCGVCGKILSAPYGNTNGKWSCCRAHDEILAAEARSNFVPSTMSI